MTIRPLLGATLLAVTQTVSGDRGSFTPLGTPDLLPTDMSADGSRIVGRHSGSFGPNFLWTAEGGIVTLGGGCPSGRVVISGDGERIAGCAVTEGGLWEAAEWIGGENWRALSRLPSQLPCDHYLSGPRGFDHDGSHLAGMSWGPPTCFHHAVVWGLPGGTMTDLGPGDIVGVSGDGRVLVGSVFQGRQLAARWVDGTPTLITADDGGDLGEAAAVNRDGSVIVGVGYSKKSGAAWRWKDGEGVIAIGQGRDYRTFDDDWDSWALDVSDEGSVVVGLTLSNDRGWVWRERGGFEWFDDFLARQKIDGAAGWKVRRVDAVSADGTIFAGWGTNPIGKLEGFVVSTRPR